VNIVTASGTNQLHGNVYEFLRNSALDARNYFDFGNIPPFKRNVVRGIAGRSDQERQDFPVRQTMKIPPEAGVERSHPRAG